MKLNMACLCPTYGRPRLLRNSLACFLAQEYPPENRRLFIYDDGGQFTSVQTDEYHLFSTTKRMPTLPAKYGVLEGMAKQDWKPDVFVLWDDDDLYLPLHLKRIAKALENGEPWTHPRFVWSTYTGKPLIEASAGRFWATAAMRVSAWDSIGGVPQTAAADFDQLFLGNSIKRLGIPAVLADQSHDATFVFRWADTKEQHCQWYIGSPSDTRWYGKMEINGLERQPILSPQWDSSALQTFAQLAAMGVVVPEIV